MKHTHCGVVVGFLLLLMLSPAAMAVSQTFTFEPPDRNIEDLPHKNYFAWGMNWNLPNGQEIVGAELKIKSLCNWQASATDVLRMRLLDERPEGPGIHWEQNHWPGVSRGRDNQNPTDKFKGFGTFLTEYRDYDGYAEDWSFEFNGEQLDALGQYVANDGLFGIGFDPDCHFYNSGIELSIYTDDKPTGQGAVPEPMTLAAFGLGATGLAGYIRRRRGR